MNIVKLVAQCEVYNSQLQGIKVLTCWKGIVVEVYLYMSHMRDRRKRPCTTGSHVMYATCCEVVVVFLPAFWMLDAGRSDLEHVH
jgi:hypothetical protein